MVAENNTTGNGNGSSKRNTIITKKIFGLMYEKLFYVLTGLDWGKDQS